MMLGIPVQAAADKASTYLNRKSPHWDTVIDAGAFDGSDYTLPAYKQGYNVYSFEVRGEEGGGG